MRHVIERSKSEYLLFDKKEKRQKHRKDERQKQPISLTW